MPGTLEALAGLGFLRGGFCPHYDGEVARRPSLHRLLVEDKMPPTYAADNSAAAHFVDEQLLGAVSSISSAKVYRVLKADGQAIEEALDIKYLLNEQ